MVPSPRGCEDDSTQQESNGPAAGVPLTSALSAVIGYCFLNKINEKF